MKTQVKSLKTLRQRKFFVVLPVLVLPFTTLLFWALGGGKIEESSAQNLLNTGILRGLPDAALKDDNELTKLDFYNKAQADSAKLRELMKNDPNYRSKEADVRSDMVAKGQLNTSLNSNTLYNNSNEEKIYQKLAQLDHELNNTYEPSSPESSGSSLVSNKKSPNIHSEDIDRLEQMMQTMTDPKAEDAEMKELNKLLETILDIQHPDRVQQRISENAIQPKGSVYPVVTGNVEIPVSLLNTAEEDSSINNRFYSLTDTPSFESVQNAIEAVIHETQTLVNGSTVKLRLLNDIIINGVRIPKNHFLFGNVQLNSERLTIKIKSLRYNQSIFPIDLSVYDQDGIEGIYIPGAITREVAKESADRSIQTMGLTSLDPSWEAQAATAGVQAAKNLLSRKVKLIKVTIKAGYRVLLRDDKQN